MTASTLMNKEQELRPCPFCGGTNIALVNGGLGNRFAHCDGCRASSDDGSEERAIAAWNRRSSDEQAEVVGSIVHDFTAEALANLYGGEIADRYKLGEYGAAIRLTVQHAVEHDRRHSVAHPPAVAAGGVTEEQRKAVKMAIRTALTDRMTDSANAHSWDADMLLAGCTHYHGLGYEKPAEAADKLASDAADAAITILTAALAVGDEGIREDDTIRVCPERDARCPHGMSCPYNHDRYRCDMIGSRAALKDTTHAE